MLWFLEVFKSIASSTKAPVKAGAFLKKGISGIYSIF